MAAPNTQPIYSKTGDAQWAVNMTAANNTIDLTSGTNYPVWTADATNGGYCPGVTVKVNPSQNTAATVARVWANNGSSTGTDTNSVLIGELGLPATTTSATAPQPDFYYPINRAFPAGYKVILTLGTAPGGSGEIMAAVLGGKY
jgi:hypothetical protein